MDQHRNAGRHEGRSGGRVAARNRRRRRRANVFAGLLAVVAAAAATTESRAELVAGWHFNGAKPSVSIGADVGTGVVDLTGVGGSADLFAGTDLNAFADWRAGDALGLRGTAGDGGLWIGASFGDMLGADPSQITVSFATRRSSTGFSMVRIETWRDAGWEIVDTVEVGTDWTVSTAMFTTASWAADLELRLTPLGATAGAGTFRLDNLRIDATPVPAPGAVGLAALAGAVGGRGRRRAAGPGTRG